jgi:hypothetical protein
MTQQTNKTLALKINNDNLSEFFRDFSRRNHARIVSVEILDELGVQREIKKMPLSGIAFERGRKNTPSVELMFENHPLGKAAHLTHSISNVRNVFPKQRLDGRDEALEIEDAEGNKVLLIFEQLPELGAGAMRAAASRRLW